MKTEYVKLTKNHNCNVYLVYRGTVIEAHEERLDIYGNPIKLTRYFCDVKTMEDVIGIYHYQSGYKYQGMAYSMVWNPNS